MYAKTAVEELVGSGRINVVIGNEDVEVIRYTPSQRAKFARIARGIDQLIKEDPVDMQGEVDKTRCDRCGRLLPEPNGICSACTNRLAMMQRIARYALPFKGKLALMVFLSLLFTLAELGPPYIMGRIIDDVLGVPAGGVPADGVAGDPFAFLYLLVVAYAVIRLVSFVLEIFKDRLSVWLGGRVIVSVREDLYENLSRLSMKFYNKRQVGSLISRVSNDTESMMWFLVDGVPYILTNLLLLVGILVLLFVTSWQLIFTTRRKTATGNAQS